MPKPEFQASDIPEFERRTGNETRRGKVLRPQWNPSHVNRGEAEAGVPIGRNFPTLRILPTQSFPTLDLDPPRHFPWFLSLLLLLFAATAGSAIWWFNQPRPIIGVFSTFEVPEPQPAPIEPPVFDRAQVIHKTKRGETFARVADHFGLTKEDTQRIGQAVLPLPADYNIEKQFKPGRYLSFQFSKTGSLDELVWQPEANRELVLRRGKNGDFSANIENLRGVIREHVAVGTIESSFAAAALQAGVGYDVVDELVDLFSNRIEFNKDFQPGDRFTVIYRVPVLRDGTSVGDPQILAAALGVKGQHLVATRYVGSDGKARYFDGKGEELGNSFLRYPLKFSRISSYFTTARFHPILGITRPHNGIDFAAPIGTPVRTVADGVVIIAGNKGGAGNMIKIKHSDRYSTAYLHLSAIGKQIRVGAKVQRGEVIGAVGMTGLATGPHLHFSFYDNDKYVNPLKMLLPMLDSLEAGIKIEAGYLKKVLFTLDHYQRVTLSKFYSGEE